MFDLESDKDKGSDDDDGQDWSLPSASDTKHDSRFTGDPSNSTALDWKNRSAGSEWPLSRLGHRRTIMHFDSDCFYAQVEMIRNPKLRYVPLGIKQKYSLVTCNYPAREKGVTKGISVSEAIKKCPEMVIVNGEDLTHYRELSYKISEFLLKYTPDVERLGFDENFLDITEMVNQRINSGLAKPDVEGHLYLPEDSANASSFECQCGCHHRLAVGSQIAADIRSALYHELGITGCAGVAHNKVLAKLIGSQHKPNQQTTLFPGHAVHFISHLDSPHRIPGIGWATWGRLKTLGILSVTDLQKFPLELLEKEIGIPLAVMIYNLSFGVDDSPVVKFSKPQTLSEEESFQQCSSEADAQIGITKLIDSLLPRLIEDGRTPHTLRLSVRKDSEQRWNRRESRQCSLPSSIFTKLRAGCTEIAQERLIAIAMDLFKRVVDVKCPFHLRVINVAFTNMGEIASNSISAFLSSSLCHPLHSSACRPAQNSICQLTPAIGAKEECDCLVACTSHLLSRDGSEERKRDDHLQHTTQALDCETQTMDKRCVTGIEPSSSPVPDSTVKASQLHTTHASKRKSDKSLDFFRVKQKKTGREKSFASMYCTEKPQMPDPHMSALPLEVDPEVFTQLPPEIQREIVGESRHVFSHTIKKQAECKSPRNVVKSSQAKSSSTSFLSIKSFFCPSMYTDKIILEEKMKEENTYSASVEDSLVAIKGEQVNFGEKASKVNDLTIIARDETQPAESPSASGSWMSCQRRYSSEAGEGVNWSAKKSLVLTNTNSNATDLEVPKSTLHEQGEKQNCLLSIFSSEMSVPAGIAPDVFASLPPFLQREVAADAALQRHNMATSLVELNNFQGLEKKAKRKGRPNQSHSMLNYLKKK